MKQRLLPAKLACLPACLLLLCSLASAADTGRARQPIVVPPTNAQTVEKSEAALDKQRNSEHEHDVAAGRKLVYIATFKDSVFGDNRDDISVRINGKEVDDILLHAKGNSLTFIVPTSVVLNKRVRDRSVLEIFVRGQPWHKKLPVAVIARQLRKVDFNDFRRKHDPSFARANNSSADIDAGESESYADESSTADESEEAVAEKKQDDDYTRYANLMRELKAADDDDKTVNVLQKEAENGNSFAQTTLAAIYMSGDFPNFPDAVRLLRVAVASGNADAQALLAFLYASGVARPHVPKNTGMSVLLWEFASQGGSLYGKIALAFRYFFGVDVAEDCERASLMYQEAAYNVLKQSMKRDKENLNRAKARGEISDIMPPIPSEISSIGRIRLHEDIAPVFSHEEHDLVQYILHAARRGNPDAQVILGKLYFYGATGMPQDLTVARQHFERAAGAGNLDAHAHLGFMDLRAGRNESAYKHLIMAAEGGNKIAHHGMGVAFAEGIMVEKNAELAIAHFRRAAELNVPESMYYLGMIYFEGQGVRPAPEKALKFFSLAANAGHLKAHYMIGRMSLHGIVPASVDCALTARSFKYVAEHGMWNKIMGRALRAYEDVRPATALYSYLQAAHAGIEVAQYNAAFIYDRNLLGGRHLPTGTEMRTEEERRFAYEEALELYHMSAVQGSEGAPLSLLRMGDMVYREKSDFATAASAYEKAGKFKNAEALFNLGIMHAFGKGRDVDMHLAKRFFDQAKEVDKSAILPATFAVFVLRYSSSLQIVFDVISRLLASSGLLKYLQEFWSKISGLDVSTLNRPSPDVLILTALLAALVFVVTARQRLESARRDLPDDEENEEEVAIGDDGN